ncbi:MAG: DUF5996 family protein [Acidimicrobiia bacterium]
MSQVLQALPTDGEATRATLHAYALAVAALPRAHALPHPLWWHISLSVRPDGLVTDAMALPDGGAAQVRMDPRTNMVVFETSAGARRAFPMNAGLTATEMGDALISAAAEFGLSGDYDRSKFENDDARPYDAGDALGLFQVLVTAEGILAIHRSRIGGNTGPVQLWPHGFDVAFEWFGTRMVATSDLAESSEVPAQINLGLYPAGDAYFYSNPWPFDDDRLFAIELPDGAGWHTDGWEGSTLAYADVAGAPDGPERVLAYARAVFDAAAPGLTD